MATHDPQRRRILITGISGSLARLTALEFCRRGDEVIGVDYRRKPKDFPKGIVFYHAQYNKTRISDIFRRHKPQVVVHLGRVGNQNVSTDRRFNLNVVGSAKIAELCLQYEAEKLIVVSTFHIYGAHPHNHIPVLEDEPLRGLQTIPQLSDAIQLDTQAVTWIYRHRNLRTTVLRPTNLIGAHVNNTVSRYLRLPRIPYALGFNPMWQFIHESDMLRALLAVADTPDRWGVYNIAGDGSIPIVEAIKMTEAPVVPVPASLVPFFVRFAPHAAPALPAYMIDFLKYPVIVSDAKFRADFDWKPQVALGEAIRTCVTRMPIQPVLG